MKKFLSLLATRQFLTVLALVAIALLIWFIGPVIAFGGMEPFARADMRVLAIALLSGGVLLWLAGWSTSVVFVGLVCLLIWYASPLFSFRHTEPFASTSARLVGVAIVLALFAAYWAMRLWEKLRTNERFVKSLLEFGDKAKPSAASARLGQVDGIIAGALAELKTMRTGARGLRRLFQRRRYLYELPWYIALGSKASGKTNALLNAGLSFPLADQLQRVPDALARSTDVVQWWLTNDAVLIDTPGFYACRGAIEREVPLRAAASDKGATSIEAEDAASSAATDVRREFGNSSHGADAAEWFGFLSVLRKYRPRAPINGAILTVDAAELVSEDESARIAEAAALRGRLSELRTNLGIRFPVYLLITKMDQLSGFTEYFGSLTSESRTQTWGFALPYGKETIANEGISTLCRKELGLLASRLTDGVNNRLLDEYDVFKRRKVAVLSEEFSALVSGVEELIERVFVDSRYDCTQLHTTLRGVFFTSAAQSGREIAAQPNTIARFHAAQLGREPPALTPQCAARKSYFLHDLISKIIIPESHLVRPNLRWETRLRVVRFCGHAFACLFFTWLAIGLWVSFDNNHGYLDAIGHKAQALAARVSQLYEDPKPEAIPDTLTDARALPTYPGLDLANPPASYGYGLYAAADLVTASHHTYNALEDNLLLPQIVRRMEDVISRAIAKQDSKAAYDTLRVYLMLYDKPKFNAADVKAWLLDDWATTDSAAVFGGRVSMIDHVQQLFSGARVVQSPLLRNDALIQQARALLDGSNVTQRLYERAKAAMQKEAPVEFTLIRAVGPQAGTVFTRASGAPLSRGVPGLFTFDGYRTLFAKRLPEFVQAAHDDDAWVMGRSYLGGVSAPTQTAATASTSTSADDPLTDAIRRQYLNEYAQQWDAFLGDIRAVTGTSLGFSLQVLRRFAAPDSPLARLARAAVRETTLAQPVALPDGATADGVKAGRATDHGQSADQLSGTLGIRAEEGVERELVDNRFAALRELVTGSADARSADQASTAPANKTGVDGVTNLLTDYYTALTVAENALVNNSMPPAGDTAAKLKITANTMPPPLRAVLLDMAAQGSREVNRRIGQLLSRQMEAVVGDTCRLMVEGNYPFAPDGKREIGIDDFTRMFAQGGVIDDFFTKTLAPFVDTSARPWRYKTLPGATEPVQGPDLEPFQHAKAIRDVFFSDAGQKQLAWKVDIRIPELDPNVLSLTLDIDGQTTVYQHGPVVPWVVNWPGPRGGVHAEITANPRIRPDTSTLATDGPWALMRMLQKGQMAESATPGRARVAFDFDGRKAVLDILNTGSVANPLTSDVLKTFKCPSSMPTFGLADTGPPPGLPPGLPPAGVAR
ncbi:type VI secretion system membrane subunit TssM [Trinickia mobilis]|uniref:type VI secretion system membrane subunit TssM n=1 Tax=Trinickia mobilis TaxID=2816356 RepID=UPI001A8FF81E|nr:type VI secretion system membrane subunit TssM [Trinickia mobilis]